MIKLIYDYFKYKSMKYRVLNSTAADLAERVKAQTLRGLTLTELGQIDYMGAELARIGAAAFAEKKEPSEAPPDEAPHLPGQYL